MGYFLNDKNKPTFIVSDKVRDESIKKLEKLGKRVVRTRECKPVYDSVAYHPDIAINPLGDSIVVAPNVYEYYNDVLKNEDIKVVKGSKTLGNTYPDNIAYNVGQVGRYAVHNFKYTDPLLKKLLVDKGFEFINIKQGYSKCSMAIIDEKSLITADIPIYKKMTEKGIDTLLIKPGNIKLYQQEYGFIGGCFGSLGKDTILISGRLINHPDKERIEKFIKDKGKKMIYLSNNIIEDIGSIISI